MTTPATSDAQNGPAVTLRRLRPADVSTVAGFEREIAEISFPDDPVTDLGFYERKLATAIDDRKAEAIVAVEGERIVGWAWLAERENFTTRERYGDLRSFYVVKAKRGAGPAFALMRACVEACRARGLTRIVGRTAATNVAMQAVYEIYGFGPKHIVYELPVPIDAAAEQRRVTPAAAPWRKHGRRRPGSRAP